MPISIYALSVNIGPTDSPAGITDSLQLLFIFSIIALAPFLLLMLTSFTRIIISLHFLRAALGTQQMPPNQVLIGLALFLTLFIMGPVFTEINERAMQPYSAGFIGQEEAMDTAMAPLRQFMIQNAETRDIALFVRLAGIEPQSYDDIPNRVIIPAFMLGELAKGFRIGFVLYIPFIVIDMVVASVLMAMGMMMLPPAMISLPFKLMFFVLADGWNLIIQGLISGFMRRM